jgi:hypothetical protein
MYFDAQIQTGPRHRAADMTANAVRAVIGTPTLDLDSALRAAGVHQTLFGHRVRHRDDTIARSTFDGAGVRHLDIEILQRFFVELERLDLAMFVGFRHDWSVVGGWMYFGALLQDVQFPPRRRHHAN